MDTQVFKMKILIGSESLKIQHMHMQKPKMKEV